jgi:IS5 family transposase
LGGAGGAGAAAGAGLGRAPVPPPVPHRQEPRPSPGQALFRHKKLRYRGLAKNTAQLYALFALANLVIVKKTLLAPGRA